MLVLTRKNGEQLHIETDHGEVTSIHITNRRGDLIRIAFDAPASCCILQEELIFANEEAAKRKH